MRCLTNNLTLQLSKQVYRGSVLRSDIFNTPIDCSVGGVRQYVGRGNASNMAIYIDRAGIAFTRLSIIA
jgi:hypothetical protein